MLDNRLLVLMLGGFLVVYACYMFAVQWLGLPQFRCSGALGVAARLRRRFFDTIFGGGGGTLVVIYMNARGFDRMKFRATLAMLWFIEMMARIGLRDGEFFTRDVLLLVCLLPFMGRDVDRRAAREPRSPGRSRAYWRGCSQRAASA